MNLKKIIIAVDMEKDSLKCLEQLRTFPIPKDSEVHLVHVFELNFMSFDIIPVVQPSPEDYLMIQKLMEEKLLAVKDKLGLDQQNVVVKCLFAPNARQEFLNYTMEQKASLVISASKERQGFKGLFESSFTAFLNKYSRSNLLILRPES